MSVPEILENCKQKWHSLSHITLVTQIPTQLYPKKGPPMKTSRTLSILLGSFVLVLTLASQTFASAPTPPLPNPILYLTSTEFYTTGGNNFIRYNYDVLNKDAYPSDFFAAAPALPPCGKNAKASRTWVDFFNSRGKRLYGFCAFTKPSDLGSLWFALPEGEIPPSYVYIELNDRQTNTKYKSNLADTTL